MILLACARWQLASERRCACGFQYFQYPASQLPNLASDPAGVDIPMENDMAYLDVAPMVVALRTTPEDFKLNNGWLRHRPSRSFPTAGSGSAHNATAPF